MTTLFGQCRAGRPGLFLLGCLALLPGPRAALAQGGPPAITQVRLGLPAGAGEEAGRSRRGSWAPVYVTLQAGREGNVRDSYLLVLEARDREEAPYRYFADVPALGAEQQAVVCLYFRPVQLLNEVTLRLQTAQGQTLQTLKHTVQDTAREIVGAGALLFTTLGASRASMQGLVQGLTPAGDRPPPVDDEDRGARRFAFIEKVELLPDFWVGYDAADVVVLTTGSEAFVRALIEDPGSKRQALLEWVRRGGRLVLSVGGNHQLAAELLDRMPGLIPASVRGSRKRAFLRQLPAWVEGEPLRDAEIADLQAGPGSSVLIRERPERDDTSDRPLVLQSACGLGRVLLVGLDVDRAPFTEWKGQKPFWNRLREELTPRVEPRGLGEGLGFDEQTGRPRQEILSELQRSLETFPEVPVISFGWVALFVLFYILLVGPIDYFVLKKLFKRLELTWVTFPVTVIVVSVAAYLTAWYVKGDDLRVNKIDLVDIDLGERQAYGHTWVTLFSPRISTYTLGVAPAAPGWVAPPARTPPTHPTVLAPLSSPDRETRLGTQSLFPQPYDYAGQAAGIRRMPIPVWSTRTFAASWRAPLARERPAVDAELDFSRLDATVPRGKITNNLPAALEGVTLFYQGRWYSLGTLGPGESRRVETLFEGGRQGQGRDQWFRTDVLRPGTGTLAEGMRQLEPGESAYQLVKTLMFYAESNTTYWLNSGLRPLDQSWRLRPQPVFPPQAASSYREEVILVARTAPRSGPAEAVLEDGGTPSRLWLGELPAPDAAPPPVPGTLTQETYLRVFIPIRREP